MDVSEPASSDSPSHNPTALYMNLLWRRGGGIITDFFSLSELTLLRNQQTSKKTSYN